MKETERAMFLKRLRMEENAQLIAEAYPSVKSIRIIYRGESASVIKEEKSGERTYLPTDKACFLLPCPNSTCTGIGFNMDAIISNMVHAHSGKESGEVCCHEYEDAERYGQHECLSVLRYTILAEYLDQR